MCSLDIAATTSLQALLIVFFCHFTDHTTETILYKNDNNIDVFGVCEGDVPLFTALHNLAVASGAVRAPHDHVLIVSPFSDQLPLHLSL